MRKFGLLALAVFATLTFSQAAQAAQIDLFFDQTTAGGTDYAVTAHADTDWVSVGFGAIGGTGVALIGLGGGGTDTIFQVSFSSPAPGPPTFYQAVTGNLTTFPASTTVNIGLLSVGSPLQGGNIGVFFAGDILNSTLDVLYDAPAVGAFGVNPGLDASDVGISTVTVQITNIPEPTTMVLLGAGLAGLAFLRRRKV